MSNLYLPGSALSSPWGKDQPYDAVWDSTLALWDGGIDPLESVPAHGATVPNLMADRMADITGLSEANCQFTVANTLANGFAAAEITAKGGLHVASTQAGAQNAQSYLQLHYSQAFAEWLLANTGEGLNYAVLFSVWLRFTRAGTGTGLNQSVAHICHASSGSANRLFVMQNGGGGLAGIQLIPGQTHNTLDVPGVAAVASAGWAGTRAPNMSAGGQRVLCNGGAANAWGSTSYNKAPSVAIYRAQLDIVDLSEIDGADRAAKATAMLAIINAAGALAFAEGGRFHGDTPTPAIALKA